MTYIERHADKSYFIESGEWEVESALLRNNLLKYYGPNKLPYPDVTLTLKIKRRPLYYCIYIVLPSALFSVLSLLSFILPTDNGERISLVNGILVANSVYILIVFSMLPVTSEAIPALGIYLTGNTILIVVCLCATCLSIKCCGRTHPMSEFMTKRFIFIGKYVGVKFIEEDIVRSRTISSHLDNEGEESNTGDIALENMTSKKLIKSFEDALRRFTEELHSKHEKVAEERETAANEELWKRAAKILDRVFLFLSVVCYTGLILFFLRFQLI
jgi:hypothetical protein